MRRSRIVLASFVVAIVAIVVAAIVLLPRYASQVAARGFSDLAVCLAGPDRVPADEAVVRARRLHGRASSASLGACASIASELAQSRWVRHYHPNLASRAADAADALFAGRLPDVAALWASATGVAWTPTLHGAASAPTPLLDRELPELRTRLTGYAQIYRDVDRHPLDEVIVDHPYVALSVSKDDRGRPFAATRWATATRARRWNARADQGEVVLHGLGRALPVGKGERAWLVGDFVVRQLASEIRARRVADDGTLGPDLVAPAPPNIFGWALRTCRSAKGHAIAIGGEHSVAVLFLDDATLVAWGDVERARLEAPMHTGDWTISCGDDGARVAFAVSDPVTHDHRIVVASCTVAGCVRREAKASGIDAGWQSVGGYGSSMYMVAPDVVVLDDRVLVLWRNGLAVLYRLDDLDALDAAPSRWIAEMSHPEPKEDHDPRTIAWPEMEILARGGTALVVVSESRDPSASFLLRFDHDRNAEVLVPPVQPARP